MNKKSQGIHHITAIASDPQRTYDFYAKLFGLKLVKKSVNQDQVEAYHLFFGDRTGEPGMDLTFFTFEPVVSGVQGVGSVTLISLAIRQSSTEFWQSRLSAHDIAYEPSVNRFGLDRITFTDPDGLHLELVAVPDKTFALGVAEVARKSDITIEQAIGYFYSARLTVVSFEPMQLILERLLGYKKINQESMVGLYRIPSHKRAVFLELEVHPIENHTASGAGTVHHIAFQVSDELHLLEMRKLVQETGLYPTEVIDRFYFKSVYFRSPDGILFELATNGPGFTVDEPESSLGKTLKLPPWLEPQREQIVAGLKPIHT